MKKSISKNLFIQSSIQILSLAIVIASSVTFAQSQTVDPSRYSQLKWRNIGPFRGGRVSAVSGVVGQPGTFYIGLPLGGVWKTTSAGTTWTPIMDSVTEASSVGAVEVAPSDPNIIYVGMGDLITGGGINEGNGVYKSTDAGKTWVHMGLDDTKQIPSILVDPTNPDIVMVAAQGNIHKKSDDRGLYRSTDGGKTWTKTLFVDDETGIQKITWAFDNPKVMLATTVRHFYAPGINLRGGSPEGATPPKRPAFTGTTIFKSIDEGLTWTEVKGKGLPTLNGRTCVAIAKNTNSQRMFLVGNFGLYRSDDGGENWRRMDAKDPRVANGQGGYNCGIYVSPTNPDLVYLINTSSYVSNDGGETFTGFKGAPGGDDPQQMWIDPTMGNRMILGTDQGATVSLDAGGNWSSWYNQATAQVYHIATDNRFPFWVYATQQDSGSIGTASRGNYGEITPLDWTPHPGYEFGSITVDPLNPEITYAGGEGRGISKVTFPSGQWINVSPNMDGNASLRQVGNQPLAFSPTNPHELFVGFQYLMSTTDGGLHWNKLSPDLGVPKGYKPPAPRVPTETTGAKPVLKPVIKPTGTTTVEDSDQNQPLVEEDGNSAEGFTEQDETNVLSLNNSQFGGPGLGSIESFSPSSVNGGVIWVGTSNGLIQVTKNHGKTWDNVTIPHLENPLRADISAIDASHQDPGTAYVAIDYHVLGDYKPYFYRTHDFGKTWTKIVNGLPTDQPSGSFSRVIRADITTPGLIFAGTESSVYVSFNDGDNWQPLTLNAPNTSYRDMVVHGNDLVVGTYGRSFWVLDDISPLRALASEEAKKVNSEPAYLYKPETAIRVRRNVNDDTPFPPEVPHALNPPDGAILDYNLASAPVGTVSIEIQDSAGNVIRHLSSDVTPSEDTSLPPEPNFWLATPHPLTKNVGMNRTNWNLRYDDPPAFSHEYKINANPGLTPTSPEGPLVGPGKYVVVLSVDGKEYRQPITVVNDPRSPASVKDVEAQCELQNKLYEGSVESMKGFNEVNDLNKAVTNSIGTSPNEELKKAAEDINSALTLIGGTTGFNRFFFMRQGKPPEPTFTMVNMGFDGKLDVLDTGDMAPSDPAKAAAAEELKSLADVEARFKAFKAKELVTFNELLKKNGLSEISKN